MIRSVGDSKADEDRDVGNEHRREKGSETERRTRGRGKKERGQAVCC